AEDGIRDSRVTGVQTCALPICPRCVPRAEGHLCHPERRRSRRARLADHPYRRQGLVPRAVADLTPAVIAPAIRQAPRGQAATVPPPEGAHRCKAQPASDRRRRRSEICRAGPQLTVAVGSPAVADTRRCHTATVEYAGAHARKGDTAIHGKRGAAAVEEEPSEGAGRRRGDTELAVGIVAPAKPCAAGRDAAHVKLPGA